MQANLKTLSTTLLHRVSKDLVTLLEAMPEDRLHWKPADSVPKSAFEQIHECIIVNVLWAGVIRNRGVEDVTVTPPDVQAIYDARLSTREEIVVELHETIQALLDAIADIPDDETGNRVPVWVGTMPLAECFLYPYWHLVYHEGQINLLQTCYGDQKHYHNYET